MEQFSDLTEAQLVAVVDAALNQLTCERPSLATDREQLEVLAAAIRAQGRLLSWLQTRAAQLDATEVAERAHGTSLATWAITTLRYTHREAARLVKAGQRLTRFPTIAQAALAGGVHPAQAEAITAVLADLPDDLPATTMVDGEQLMVEFAGTHNSAELRRLSSHLLECVAPDVADQKEADRLEREHRQATRNRHLTFTPDHQGSVFLRGSLPTVDAEQFIALIDSYVTAQNGIDTLDPLTPTLTPGMRRADALMAMVNAHAGCERAPNRAGDRPRATITLNYHTLHAAAHQHGVLRGRLISTGEPIPGSVLRRLLCDADILPIVLDGNSQPLDVGRAQRLVTPPIRAALDIRDQGCVFPGCDKPPTACHAHHILPWWAGGATALHNLVLLCPHHHGLVEPSHRRPVEDPPQRTCPDHHPTPTRRPHQHTPHPHPIPQPHPTQLTGHTRRSGARAAPTPSTHARTRRLDRIERRSVRHPGLDPGSPRAARDSTGKIPTNAGNRLNAPQPSKQTVVKRSCRRQ